MADAHGNTEGEQTEASVLGLTLHPPPAETEAPNTTPPAPPPESTVPSADAPEQTAAPSENTEALSEHPAAPTTTDGAASGEGTEPSKEVASEEAAAPTSPVEPKSPTERGARKPRRGTNDYINPDRVKTGGQRDKPSEDELTERMARIRLQNEKIIARREQADRDAEAYEKTMAQEREAAKQRRRIQQEVNNQRMENARRKMGNMAGREWDAGKDGPQQGPANPYNDERGRGRGGHGRGGRGGRGAYPPRGLPPHMVSPTSAPTSSAAGNQEVHAATVPPGAAASSADWTTEAAKSSSDWTQG